MQHCPLILHIITCQFIWIYDNAFSAHKWVSAFNGQATSLMKHRTLVVYSVSERT
jgi:hypothetical protein